MKKQRYALIVAAGSGSRMGSKKPKQFLMLGGKPLLMQTLQQFYAFDPQIQLVLVLSDDHRKEWGLLCRKYSFHLPYHVVSGGNNRFQSVRNGLRGLSGEGLVGIHDGVRPLIDREMLERCYGEASSYGNAIPSIAVMDTVRELFPKGNRMVDRTSLRLLQTPQVFSLPLIQRAYSETSREDFTDDAGVFEQAGHPIRLVEGNRNNIKITTPADLKLARILFKEFHYVHC